MSSISGRSAMDGAPIERDDQGSCDGITRGWLRGCISGAVRYILLGSLSLVSIGVGLRVATASQTPSRSIHAVAAVPTSAPVLPATPADGVLTLVIPPGAAADQRLGGRGYTMPDVIQLTAGDTIVLRNDDSVPHMILYAFLMPGQTHERTLLTPGSEVYSSGCGVHGASFLNFTTIFVSEPGR
jgi:hypothetical protein